MPPVDRDPDRKGGTRGDAGRAERLAAELRQNLRRRKARARALEAQPPPSTAPDGRSNGKGGSDASG